MLYAMCMYSQETDVALASENVSSIIDDYAAIDNGSWRCSREFVDVSKLAESLFPDF